MGLEINLMDLYPKTKRPIEERGNLIKPEHKEIARRFGEDFFDGERLYGYGGYSYHKRFWPETVKRFRDFYSLSPDAAVLDIGCAKGFMLHDFKELMPDLKIAGLDISGYAISNAIDTVRPYLQVGSASDLPYDDKSFDLVISINTLHNLPLEECKRGFREIERVSKKNSFISVDAWRTEDERVNLSKWNLTALTYMHVDDWKKLFLEAGYTGDYYWFIAESE